MKQTKKQEIPMKKTQPVHPSGSIKVAGEVIAISKQAVKRTPGSSPRTLLRRIREASGKIVFPTTVLLSHE